jgi:hypothetical protein
MSATQATPLGAPNSAGTPTTRTDQIIAAGRDLPNFLARAEQLDPPTADKWTGKALIASKSPWGTFAGAGVTWLVTKYGLGWDQTACDLVAGGAVLIFAYAMRLVTELPITGLFTKATAAQAAAKAAPVAPGGAVS